MGERQNAATVDAQAQLAAAEAKCSRLVAEVERLQSALEEIENPIFFMQKRADDDGRQIDGAESVRLANDANYLRRLARDARRGVPVMREDKDARIALLERQLADATAERDEARANEDDGLAWKALALCKKRAEAAEAAALSHPAEGWRTVPVEPTAAMATACREAVRTNLAKSDMTLCRAVLSTIPAAPAAKPEGGQS